MEQHYNIDYDLFVIDPNNSNSTDWQIRDCIYDALKVIDDKINKRPSPSRNGGVNNGK